MLWATPAMKQYHVTAAAVAIKMHMHKDYVPTLVLHCLFLAELGIKPTQVKAIASFAHHCAM